MNTRQTHRLVGPCDCDVVDPTIRPTGSADLDKSGDARVGRSCLLRQPASVPLLSPPTKTPRQRGSPPFVRRPHPTPAPIRVQRSTTCSHSQTRCARRVSRSPHEHMLGKHLHQLVMPQQTRPHLATDIVLARSKDSSRTHTRPSSSACADRLRKTYNLALQPPCAVRPELTFSPHTVLTVDRMSAPPRDVLNNSHIRKTPRLAPIRVSRAFFLSHYSWTTAPRQATIPHNFP